MPRRGGSGRGCGGRGGGGDGGVVVVVAGGAEDRRRSSRNPSRKQTSIIRGKSILSIY